MQYAVDFKAIAARISVLAAAGYLGLEVKKGRSACPACQQAGERAIQYNEDNTIKCWPSGFHGDSVALVAHIRKTRMLQAAKELDGAFPINAPKAEPKVEKKKGTFDAKKFKDSLNTNVEGLPEELLERVGMGMSNTALKGLLAIPIYAWDDTREPICFIGVPPETVQLPKTHREPAKAPAKLRLVG